MKKLLVLTAAVAIGMPALMAGAAVTGKIILKGTPPKEVAIQPDPLCGRLHTEAMTTHHYVAADDGGLKDVFVYIKEAPGGKTYEPPADAKTPVLDQVNCFYTPYVSGILVNQRFIIRNSDPLMHNVHATPKVDGNKEFNVGQPVKGMEYPTSFPKREILLRFKCDVHAWMFAYVGVMDHPWFAVTNEKGEYKLPPDLPAGEYTLVALHRKAGELTQKITVADGDKKTANFTMEVPK